MNRSSAEVLYVFELLFGTIAIIHMPILLENLHAVFNLFKNTYKVYFFSGVTVINHNL